MAKGSNSAGRRRHGNAGGNTCTDEYTGRSVSFEEDVNESSKAMEEDYDLEEKNDILKTGARPLAQNPVEELDEIVGPEPAFGNDDDDEGVDDGDDSKQAVTTFQVTEQKTGYRPPMNGDTPAEHKVLGRTYEEMLEKSMWIKLFEPKMIRQAVWADLSHELAIAVTATTTGQVASDMVQFL
ncbi:hypothetical protein PHMEG_00013906 [Phytophthora megakarya]|uniref:Eukaryotic/viral aspartic protease n=1 Tax=Phytophthora megakarya TaxID=4795 RepID=A0A225W6M5_9STRA|nr:hypothetical protein PHMEG_00013906 [Phytophthora megakarya]